MINNFKNSGEQKIQLTMKPKFMASTDSNEKRTIHTQNENAEIMIGEDRDEIIQERFDSLLRRCQTDNEKSMKAVSFGCMLLSCHARVSE